MLKPPSPNVVILKPRKEMLPMEVMINIYNGISIPCKYAVLYMPKCFILIRPAKH